jgi:hypothetical protein
MGQIAGATGHRREISCYQTIHALDVRETGRKGQCRENVIWLQIFIVGQDGFTRHATGQSLEQHRHRIAHSTNAGLSMTYGGVNGDSV